MVMSNSPVLFDDTAWTPDDRAYLDQKELCIKRVLMQSALETGRELKEVRQWFADSHKRGFENWVQACFGYSRVYAERLIKIYENLDANNCLHLDFAISAQYELANAPNPQNAVDEALLRKQIEGEITAKKAKEIAEYQRAEKIARDEMRSALERTAAIDRQVAYVKQQLVEAQKARLAAEQKVKQLAEQEPQIVEKVVEKQVVPPNLQEHIRKLEEKHRQLQRERDSYRQQLHDERAVAQARMLENLEGENADRINVKFADAMRDYTNNIRVALNHLPSLVDTQSFDADSWQRLDEAIEKTTHMMRELQKLKQYVSNGTYASVVDAGIAQLWEGR